MPCEFDSRSEHLSHSYKKLRETISVNLKNVIHHGSEAIACIGLGAYAIAQTTKTTAVSSLQIASGAYGVGKLTYLGTKFFLSYIAPQIFKGTSRKISYAAALTASAATLYVTINYVTKDSLNAFTTATVTTGSTLGGVAVRYVADKIYKHL
jgi:hypothetical protein